MIIVCRHFSDYKELYERYEEVDHDILANKKRIVAFENTSLKFNYNSIREIMENIRDKNWSLIRTEGAWI